MALLARGMLMTNNEWGDKPKSIYDCTTRRDL